MQALHADVLFGDWGYFCTPALSEVLKIPRVTVSNIPVLDPLTTTWDKGTGRRMHMPNMLAYTPQASRWQAYILPIGALLTADVRGPLCTAPCLFNTGAHHLLSPLLPACT